MIRICPDCGFRLIPEEGTNPSGDRIIRLTCGDTCTYRGEWQLLRQA
jgi:hypothetical protein